MAAFRAALVPILVLISSTGITGRLFSNILQNPGEGDLWAVLVAGSEGWVNYRHQADVCHAYHVLHNHGIPDDRIIVLMKDDLAMHESNPTPGIIINHPLGKDVYEGVPHDHTGEALTPENFMAVLRGDEAALKGTGSGKVLKSGPKDHVFVYFSDHGAPGLISFPSSELSATDLNKTIHYMYAHKKYAKMVIYIEACESGSMFENLLPNNINVYATTAANGTERSHGCYYDDDRDTYLGDAYSVHWMEDSDQEVLTQETLIQQYEIVKKETKSQVQEYGDMKIGKMHVSEFQGRKPAEPIRVPKVLCKSVTSRDVPIEIMRRKAMKSNSKKERSSHQQKLAKMLRNRSFLSDKVSEILGELFQDEAVKAEMVDKHHPLRNFECYDRIRQYFSEECFNISKNPYSLDFLYVLVNLCEKNIPPAKVKMAMEKVCVHPPIHDIL